MTNSVSRTVSDETLNCIITIESGGNPRAKAQTSSATGLFQFLDATWMGVIAKHRPDLMRNRTRAQILAMRTDPKIAIELGARFTEDNQRVIGMNCTGGDLYLAHFLGTADAKDLFRAPPDTPVSQLVTSQVINANKSIMLGKSAGQVRAWAAKRMAASGGHNWIAKYYEAEPEQAPQPAPEPVPAPEPEPTAEDIPDPQDAPPTPLPQPRPVPQPAPVPVPNAPADPTQITPAPKETFWEWIDRKRKTVWGSVSGIMGGGGVLTYFTDWKVLAVIVAGLIIGVSIIYAFWLLSRSKT